MEYTVHLTLSIVLQCSPITSFPDGGGQKCLWNGEHVKWTVALRKKILTHVEIQCSFRLLSVCSDLCCVWFPKILSHFQIRCSYRLLPILFNSIKKQFRKIRELGWVTPKTWLSWTHVFFIQGNYFDMLLVFHVLDWVYEGEKYT
jgi:hypothetical protein